MGTTVAQSIAGSARDVPTQSPAAKYDIVLLSTDAALRAAIHGALGRDATVWSVTSAQNAVGTLVAGRCAVFVADLSLIPDEYAALFDKLAAQFPDLVLMAAGGRAEERFARPLLSSGLVYRFLHTPVSHARAASFMTAALRRHAELRALQTTMLSTMKLIVTTKPRWSIGVTTAIALVAVVGAAASFHFRSQQTVAPKIAATEIASTASAGMQELLSKAQVQMTSRNLIAPDHHGALDLYQAATQLDSSNAEAQAGLQKTIDVVLTDVESALRERNVTRALDGIAAVKRVRPTHPRLAALESRAAQLSLSKRYPKRRLKPVQPSEVDATPPDPANAAAGVGG